MSNKITELEKQIKDLESQLDNYRRFPELVEDIEKLKSEVYDDIQKVWMYDSSLEPLTDKQKLDSMALIYKVFYKIANQWID
jgi:chromosome segregation ATPase